mmetsp:Transcript_6505/g.19766  ORF Transcript_6505/g.19766 Transcript_6505/m.19766 type:complete len:216 (+) Transcript_6505:1152-1799(+)
MLAAVGQPGVIQVAHEVGRLHRDDRRRLSRGSAMRPSPAVRLRNADRGDRASRLLAQLPARDPRQQCLVREPHRSMIRLGVDQAHEGVSVRGRQLVATARRQLLGCQHRRLARQKCRRHRLHTCRLSRTPHHARYSPTCHLHLPRLRTRQPRRQPPTQTAVARTRPALCPEQVRNPHAVPTRVQPFQHGVQCCAPAHKRDQLLLPTRQLIRQLLL